tara:strand:- start:9955 stop:10155 length:201 start_codon:yes stop_codon:yes gene_type:complete
MLTEKELSSLAKIRSQIVDANSNIAECSDLWLSDVRHLADIPWQLDALIRNNTPKVEDEPSGLEEN